VQISVPIGHVGDPSAAHAGAQRIRTMAAVMARRRG